MSSWHEGCFKLDPERIMKRTFFILLALALMVPVTATAQQRIPALQQNRTRLQSHRGRLEVRLGHQSRRIRRLKAQPAGVRRDYQLRTALRSSRELSAKLSRLQNRINGLSRQMVRAYDGAIARTRNPARRAQLVSRRAELQAKVRGKKDLRVVTDERANPLDSPEDLEEKAELLEDSQVKVKRQLSRVRKQLTLLNQRARLRRHARAADHNPFDESSAGRTARANKAATTNAATGDKKRQAAPQAPDDNNKQGGAWQQPSGKKSYNGTPAPPKNPGTDPGNTGTAHDSAERGGTRGTPATGLSAGGGSATGAQPSLTLKDIMDPSVLKELRRSARSGKNLRGRIKILVQAQKRLDRMSKSMGNKAHKLRKKATSLRGKK